ncbi:Ammonium transporter [Planctomycetales bacterium 10988]|nr:Ammonium transporter [Planctomycetales bacterium 10988]
MIQRLRTLTLFPCLLSVMMMSLCWMTTPAISFAQEEAEATAEEEPAEEEAAPEEEEEAAPLTADEVAYALDNLILFIAGVLVFFMQGGFAMVEAGFNESKCTVNILFKNIIDLSAGVLLYYFVGYGLMYPGDAATNAYFGFAGIGVDPTPPDPTPGTLYAPVDFFFQAAFAATAATIVSGAVAGRMRFVSYLIYTVFLTALVYPISGYWKWGGGWLDQMGFWDFAGSLVVHAVGGFAGLAGAIVLGPRIGRYSEDGKPQAMPGHNLPIAALGVIILWIGWYGFNPGSNLVFSDPASVEGTMRIAVTTTLAAGAGGVFATILSWILFKKPDLSMGLNGILAGLVGITANCDCVEFWEAIVIGAVAGLLVVLGIIMLDALRIDDPVGAFPVHGLCGVWGGLATWIFGGYDMIPQIVGSIVIPAWAFFTMLILFLILRVVGILRVSAEDEQEGVDVVEHGMHAYGSPQV